MNKYEKMFSWFFFCVTFGAGIFHLMYVYFSDFALFVDNNQSLSKIVMGLLTISFVLIVSLLIIHKNKEQKETLKLEELY